MSSFFSARDVDSPPLTASFLLSDLNSLHHDESRDAPLRAASCKTLCSWHSWEKMDRKTAKSPLLDFLF